MNDDIYQDDEEEKDQPDKSMNVTDNFNNWPSSRIIRVSRASGGKDRHSKVLTSRGELRDRRVRLSVGTAIQLYDLQERLGYDQPSKAVEWLLKAASSSIDGLPRINSPLFQGDTTYRQPQLSDEKSSSGSDRADMDMDVTVSTENNSVIQSSGLSLSRSESRVRARERGKQKALLAQEKEKKEDYNDNGYLGLKPIMSRDTSFNELLSGGMSHVVLDNNNKQWDNYFTSGLMEQHGDNSSSSSGFSGGTLQSNSCSSCVPQSFAPQLQGFFNVSSLPVDNNHHQFITGFDSQLQLCYGNAHVSNGNLKVKRKK